MPYTSVQDVRDLAPYVPINSQSTPNEGVVAKWIVELESLLDAALTSEGFGTPLVSPVNREWARQIIAHRVMARVMRARPNPEQDPNNFQLIADREWGRLRDPKDNFTLIGEVIIGGDIVVKDSPMRVSSNLKDLVSDPYRTPHATRDMKF